MSWIVRFKRLYFDDTALAQGYARAGRPDLAWMVLALQSIEELRRDPTSTYTVNSAERDLLSGQFAVAARAYEWAWVNASDCMAILEWKGQLRSKLGDAAKLVLQRAEENISSERIADLRERHAEVISGLNSLTELRFKESIHRERPWIWKRAMRGSTAANLKVRPY